MLCNVAIAKGFHSCLPEHTGINVSGQVMDKDEVSQAGQRVFRITHLLLQKARNLFPPQQRQEHKAGEGLSDDHQGALHMKHTQ